MSPQARYKLPPELDGLTRQGMETVIYQANLGRENSQIASWISSRKWTLQQNCILAAPPCSAAFRRSWRG